MRSAGKTMLYLGLGQAGESDLVLVIPSESTGKVHARAVPVKQCFI